LAVCNSPDPIVLLRLGLVALALPLVLVQPKAKVYNGVGWGPANATLIPTAPKLVDNGRPGVGS